MRCYDRALRILSVADEGEIKINKRNAAIHLNKARVFVELKRFYEAYNEAKAAIEIMTEVTDGGENGILEMAYYRFVL